MSSNPRTFTATSPCGLIETKKHRPGTGRTVLLVEDEAIVRGVVREFLHTLGFSVLEAMNGVQALEMVARCRGQITLILTDEVMPAMGGSDLLNRVRLTSPEVRGILMSGYLDRNGKTLAFESDRYFLQKPFTLSSLRDAVTRLFQETD